MFCLSFCLTLLLLSLLLSSLLLLLLLLLYLLFYYYHYFVFLRNKIKRSNNETEMAALSHHKPANLISILFMFP